MFENVFLINNIYIKKREVYFIHFRFDEKKIPLFIGLKRECIYRKKKLYDSIKRAFEDLLGVMLFSSYLLGAMLYQAMS